MRISIEMVGPVARIEEGECIAVSDQPVQTPRPLSTREPTAHACQMYGGSVQRERTPFRVACAKLKSQNCSAGTIGDLNLPAAVLCRSKESLLLEFL